jgi:diguanylate cyclase (GGDEF)-like protein/PAS domain S-box-containing protein
MTVLAAASYALPSYRFAVWALLGASSVAAMLLGIARNRPRQRRPWLLLTAAAACLTVGDLTWELTGAVRDEATPFPSVADLFYLAMYALIAAGIVGLYRLGGVRRDVAGVLDVLIVTTSVALLGFVYLVGPYLADPDVSGLDKTISIAYSLGILIGLAVGASLAATMRPTIAIRLLAIGGVGLMAAEIAFGVLTTNGTWRPGSAVDLGWITFYVCWGAAALHPTMRALDEPRLMRIRRESIGRFVVLGLASLVAPAVLLIEAQTGGVRDSLVIAGIIAVLSVLILVRLGRALLVNQRAVERESGLRRTGAALLTATHPGDVSSVVSDAVGRLVPSGRSYRVVLDLDESTDASASRGPAPPVPAEPPKAALVHTRTLPPDVATRLGKFEVALRCPVPTESGTSAALYVSAHESVLVAAQEAVQVLAAQAGLTLDRITLSEEVDRQNSEAYFRTLVVNTADVILIVDQADRIRYASPSAAALFGVDELHGAALPSLVDTTSVAEVRRRLDDVRAGNPDVRGAEWRIRRGASEDALVDVSCRDLRTEPTVDGLVVTLRDVTEGRRMQDELYRRATYDGLTGLPNRSLFISCAQHTIDRITADGGAAGVLVAELDDFKIVNNTLGHEAGDELLVQIGARLSSALRATGVVASSDASGASIARSGGDAFAACLAAATGEEAERAIGAVQRCFADPFVLRFGVVSTTVSVGVAMATGVVDPEELLRRADLAVSAAKEGGPGRSLRYEASLQASVADRLRLRNDLERAVDGDEFVLDFQPIVALGSGRTAGFEALVRWHHPTRGMLSPAAFIGLAEDSGLIVPIGDWVLRHAVEAAAGWRREYGDQGPYVSVNVSARQLRTPGFLERVRAELVEWDVPPDRLMLEITESLLLRGGGVDDELTELRADGVRVAIDDFGTGFSSLSYLRQLPVDVIKLDKSFTDAITTSDEQYAIINAVAQLAKALHLDLVAEGIETDEEIEALTALGCGYGQGFLMARPMSFAATIRRLSEELLVPLTRTAR